MRYTKKYFFIWLCLFVPITLGAVYVLYRKAAHAETVQKEVFRHKGEKFVLNDLIDTSGHKDSINLLSSKLTIVDFWFVECTACILEMKKFNQALQNRSQDISIVSVCINDFKTWKELFVSKDADNAFLKSANPLWKHLAMKSTEDPSLQNSIPAENLPKIKTRWGIASFPTYLVLNQHGEIIDFPVSAVKYIQTGNGSSGGFGPFLQYFIQVIPLTYWAIYALVYISIFWIIWLLVYGIRKITR